MSRFIELPEEEKRNVFQAVSGALGLRSDIIEKDYWVCFMLDHLFHKCKYKDEEYKEELKNSLIEAFNELREFYHDICNSHKGVIVSIY
jgi:Domain of unknown function (DUF1877).